MAENNIEERLNDEEILSTALAWKNSGKNVAIATVIKTWGSSPRPTGSQLAVSNDGTFVGSVSGGCIEGAVVTEAIEVMNSGKSKVLDFGVSNDLAWEVGLACGGQVKVLVEAIEE